MTDRRPIFSVVTVVYQDLHGLKLTAESLRRQSISSDAVEHIVVDGGSKDGTAEWLNDAYSPPYAVHWNSEPDDGIFDAMNKAVNLANGNLVVFMNANDEFSDNTVLEQVASLYRNGNWRWGYGAMRYLNEARDTLGAAIQYPFDRRRLELGLAFAPHQATFMEVDFFQQLGGFDTQFEFAADQELAMRAARAESPETWLIFVCDFLRGGFHEQITPYDRELFYHQARRKNGVLIARSIAVDMLVSYAIATYWGARKFASRALRRIRSR